MAQALAEGAVLGSYRFDRYRSKKKDEPHVAHVALLMERGAELRAARAGAATGALLGEYQNLARDLSNEPPNVLPPAALAREAEKAGRAAGARWCACSTPAELKKRGFGALLAVAQGSANEPRVIVLEHGAPARRAKKGARAAKRPTVCLVGKGVCFDSGGLSLKPSTSMTTMKHDMSGGAAVIAAVCAAAKLGLPLHVVGVVGAVENMPSGTAYRPDDIVTSLSGQTIEISNTDAEGRLVLADTLHYARTEFAPDAIVDLATLTGACSVALGKWAAALLGNHERLAERMLAAGEASGRALLAAAALGRASRVHARPARGSQADRRTRRRHDHRERVPVALRRRDALDPSRHRERREHREGLGAPAARRDRLRRALPARAAARLGQREALISRRGCRRVAGPE